MSQGPEKQLVPVWAAAIRRKTYTDVANAHIRPVCHRPANTIRPPETIRQFKRDLVIIRRI